MRLEYRQLDPETFRSLAAAARRRLHALVAVGVVLWTAPTLLARAFAGDLLVWTGLSPAALRYWWSIGVPAYASVVGATLLALRWILRDRRLMCPECGKTLLRTRNVVLTTGKCGHCGARVLSAPAPSPGPMPAVPVTASLTLGPPLRTLEEFRELAPRLQSKSGWIAVAILFLGLLLPMFALSTLDGEVRAATRPYPALKLWGSIAVLAYMACVLALAGWASLRILNDPRVRCASCRKSMVRDRSVVIATGKCGNCGAQALAPDEHQQTSV